MKKFIIIVAILVILFIIGDYAYYRLGWYIDPLKEPVSTFVKAQDGKLFIDRGNGYEEFIMKGMDIGSGEPGEWATDFDIDEETYFRWFGEIQELGANCIRNYTIQTDNFYNAFYKYNKDREEPLYLIQGVWVNDYAQNSHADAYDDMIFATLQDDCQTMIDVIHGQKKINIGQYANAGHGTYRYDVSEWVIGYILGVEWEDVTVAYTNDIYADTDINVYNGKYMYTTEEASPFEAMLARIGDKTVEYESEKYNTQKLIALSNWPTTDPFTYPSKLTKFFRKCASVDVEHIKCTEKFLSGQFASYHVYPYYPDYANYMTTKEIKDSLDITVDSTFYDEDGAFNTYRLYLTALVKHHSMPVVISEFGVSTGRGLAQMDVNTYRHQGHMSEDDQGQALIDCFDDIMESGCKGGCVFSWQDEWFKRTWNTMYAVDLKRTPYWSDYQTNEQFFGVLAYDPGKDKSVSYTDGDVSEWTEKDIVSRNDEISISAKYDERFVYLYVHKNNYNPDKDVIYIPIDTTQKSGSTYCENYNLKFNRAADFLIVIDGKENSRILAQERYESLRSTYSYSVYKYDTYIKENIPAKDSPLFVDMLMILQENPITEENKISDTFPTGELRYGNGNPESPDYDSLSDYIINGDEIEIRIPWQMLNFADPSRMQIHDDYYEHFGVEYIGISEMFIGATTGGSDNRTEMNSFELEGWENTVTSHERLKKSYYILQEYWKENY